MCRSQNSQNAIYIYKRWLKKSYLTTTTTVNFLQTNIRLSHGFACKCYLGKFGDGTRRRESVKYWTTPLNGGTGMSAIATFASLVNISLNSTPILTRLTSTSNSQSKKRVMDPSHSSTRRQLEILMDQLKSVFTEKQPIPTSISISISTLTTPCNTNAQWPEPFLTGQRIFRRLMKTKSLKYKT